MFFHEVHFSFIKLCGSPFGVYNLVLFKTTDQINWRTTEKSLHFFILFLGLGKFIYIKSETGKKNICLLDFSIFHMLFFRFWFPSFFICAEKKTHFIPFCALFSCIDSRLSYKLQFVLLVRFILYTTDFFFKKKFSIKVHLNLITFNYFN